MIIGTPWGGHPEPNGPGMPGLPDTAAPSPAAPAQPASGPSPESARQPEPPADTPRPDSGLGGFPGPLAPVGAGPAPQPGTWSQESPYPPQGYPQPTYSDQAYPDAPPSGQAYPASPEYPAGQGYPPQAPPDQPYPNQPEPSQAYPHQPDPNQAYPNPAYPNQPEPNQSHSDHAYPGQAYPGGPYPDPAGQGPAYPGGAQAWPGQPYPDGSAAAPGPVPPGAVPPGAVPPGTGAPTVGGERQYSTADLIDQLNPAVADRARRGMRARLGLKPSDREVAEAQDEELARTPFSRPVTVMVANPKGGVGKALGVAEPVLTPTGYRAIGTLKVGDLVIGTDGLEYEVFGVYPQGERDLYRVGFSDGTTVLADGEHLWEVQTGADRTEQRGECIGERRLMTTADLLAHGVSSMRADGRTKRHHFFVPACAPVKLVSTATPLDPYLLGLLLGDGSLTSGTPAFTTSDHQLVDAMTATLPDGVRIRHKSRSDYRIVTTGGRSNSLTDALRGLGVWGHGSATKFVPETYLLGDIETRVAVLQGLMDTDGTVDARGAAGCFTTVSDQLADDVKFIAESLGCVVTRKTRVTSYRHKGERRDGRPSHTLRITPPHDVQLFRLERKTAATRPPRRRPFRAITDITPAGRGEAVCIAVASPDRLFLTRSCIPTHNTPTTLLLAAAFGTCRGGGVIAWDNNELRGTMPDRSLSPHRRTVRDLLDATDHLAAPQSQFTDLAVFLNHQTPGKFHTLGSAQSFGHVVSHENFLTIHGILSRYFQIIVVDTGNNEASPNWLAAAEKADCLVVPTKWRKDSLIPAARMLETLQGKQPDLLARAVIVATNGPADSQEDVKRNGSSWFGTSHPIVEIPTDPHIAEGGVIDWSKLQPRTRRAGLSLAAQVAQRIKTVA